jgi:hypothetical protein
LFFRIFFLNWRLEVVGTLNAVPVAGRNVVQANAVCVVRRIASITEKQNIFPFAGVADWARLLGFFFLLFHIVCEPRLRIELGNLFLFFDFYAFDNGAYIKRTEI